MLHLYECTNLTLPSNHTIKGFEVSLDPQGITEEHWIKHHQSVMTKIHLETEVDPPIVQPLMELWEKILEGKL